MVYEAYLRTRKIHQRADNRANKRKIDLNIKQIILLNESVSKHRKKLLNDNKSKQLIIVGNGINALQNLLQSLAEKLKKDV